MALTLKASYALKFGNRSGLQWLETRRMLSKKCYFRQFNKTTEAESNDPRDPHVAKKNEQLHPESPVTYNPDLLSPEPQKGKAVDKFPFRMELIAGKKYSYCTCGFSKRQPFCDGSHRTPFFMSTRPHHVKYRPIRFTVEETKEYWICQCKQSNKRPFCDGTHKQQEIQDSIF